MWPNLNTLLFVCVCVQVRAYVRVRELQYLDFSLPILKQCAPRENILKYHICFLGV